MEKKKSKKVEKTLNLLVKILNKQNLNIAELIEVYGNLGYSLGTAMAKKPDGIPLEKLKEMYHIKPTVDIALMLQSLQILHWQEQFKENPVLSTTEEKGDLKNER